MPYAEFFAYNIIGGFSWIFLLTFAGYFFGQIPIVKNNFTAVIMLIIFLSILPAIVEFVKHKMKEK